MGGDGASSFLTTILMAKNTNKKAEVRVDQARNTFTRAGTRRPHLRVVARREHTEYPPRPKDEEER